MNRTLIALALLAIAVPAAAQEKSTPLPEHFPLGVEACFGRNYDAAHLKATPRQRVTAFYLHRSFEPDKALEEPPQSREDRVSADGENGMVNVTGYFRLRDRKGVFTNYFSCTKESEGNGVRCGIDCDGGSFKLRASGKSLLAENEGFVVVGGCGADEEESAKPVFIKPGTDDKTFRIDPQPPAQCTTLQNERAPVWARLGEPLRERFAATETMCLTRSYDAAHLASHPRQMVKRIAVLKTSGDAAKDAPQYNLQFRIELKNGRKLEGRTNCWPENYTYACTHDAALDTQRSFYLTRAGDDVMLRDQRGSLGTLLKATLGSDDRMFKLAQAPENACRF